MIKYILKKKKDHSNKLVNKTNKISIQTILVIVRVII